MVGRGASGHLLFPLFHDLVGGKAPDPSTDPGRLWGRGVDPNDPVWVSTEGGELCLKTLELGDLLAMGGVEGPVGGRARATLLESMRRAAEKRVAGVTEMKRRRYYDHAAQLVGTCAAVDRTIETATWVTRIRGEYCRYPALRQRLDHHLGRA